MKQVNKLKEKAEKKKKRRKIAKIIRTILLLILIGLIGYGIYFAYKVNQNGGGVSGIVKTAMGYDEEKKKDMQPINILLLGESGVGDGYKLTDTIIVCSYNPKLQKASMLSIPRDTYVGKRDKNTASQNYLASYKMNCMYRNGTNIEETVKSVATLTGLDLNYWILVDTDALTKVVDAIGGVTFNVPIDMDYDDPTQNLHIHLKAGEQLLDGDKAEQLVRFRHNNNWTTYPAEYGDNDLGRMRTQREFMQETAKQLLQAKNIFQIKTLADIAFESIKTNIDLNVIKDYIPYAVDFNTEDIQTDTLPGVPELCNGVWIYTANKTKTEKLVKELFFYEEETEETAKVKVEILNGTGKTDTLDELILKLKQYNYEVVTSGTTTLTSKTSIINRNIELKAKQNELKNIIGAGIHQNGISNNSKVDFTIILGQDYK